MLRNLRSRRRHHYGVLLCVFVSGLVVLACVTVFVLHSHVIIPHSHPSHDFNYDSLVSDSVTDDDTIDALDVVEEEPEDTLESDPDADDDDSLDQNAAASGYFFHHADGVIRRAFRKIDDDDDKSHNRPFVDVTEDRSKTAFGSDDVAVEENVRLKAIEVKGVEDALLLNIMGRRVSPLREGWGDWFDKKGDFLRKDRMLRSNLEGVNPLRNPILQDPDSVDLTGITRADKIIRKYLLHDLKNLPFPSTSTSRKTTQYHNNF